MTCASSDVETITYPAISLRLKGADGKEWEDGVQDVGDTEVCARNLAGLLYGLEVTLYNTLHQAHVRAPWQAWVTWHRSPSDRSTIALHGRDWPRRWQYMPFHSGQADAFDREPMTAMLMEEFGMTAHA